MEFRRAAHWGQRGTWNEVSVRNPWVVGVFIRDDYQELEPLSVKHNQQIIAELKRFAKKNNLPLLHVRSDGTIYYATKEKLPSATFIKKDEKVKQGIVPDTVTGVTVVVPPITLENSSATGTSLPAAPTAPTAGDTVAVPPSGASIMRPPSGSFNLMTPNSETGIGGSASDPDAAPAPTTGAVDTVVTARTTPQQPALPSAGVSHAGITTKTVTLFRYPDDMHHESEFAIDLSRVEGAENLSRLIKALGLPQGSVVLNVGCGINTLNASGSRLGRHRVINVDTNIILPAEGAETFKGDFLSAGFPEAFMKASKLTEKPAVVLFYNMYTYAGLYGTPVAGGDPELTRANMIMQLFHRARELVAPGGYILFVDFNTPETKGSTGAIPKIQHLIRNTNVKEMILFQNRSNDSLGQSDELPVALAVSPLNAPTAPTAGDTVAARSVDSPSTPLSTKATGEIGGSALPVGPLATDSSKPKPGGIDFRSLPIVIQSMDNLKASMREIAQSSLQSTDLAEEWAGIEQLVNSGITPSTERIKEYVGVSCLKGDLDQEKVVSCIAGILRAQEERAGEEDYSATDPVLKDILVVLESGRTSSELKQVFAGS